MVSSLKKNKLKQIESWHLRTILLMFLLILNISFGFSQKQSKTDSLLNVLQNSSNESHKADIYAQLCWEYRYSDSSKVFLYGNKALEIYTKQKNILGQCKVYNFLGVAQKGLGDYSSALNNYFKVLDMTQKSLNNIEAANAYNNIGEIYRILGKNEEAIHYANEALLINENIQNEVGISYNLILKGLVLGSQKKWDEALVNLRKALHLRINNENQDRLATIYFHLGNCFLELNEPDSAFLYYQKSDEKFRISNGTDISSIIFGKYYTATKQYDLAESYLLKAIEMSKFGTSEILLEMHEKLSKVYFEQKEFENAYLQKIKATEIRDSLLKIDNTRKITQLEKDLEFKIERIKFESDIKKQRLINYGLAILILLAIVFVYFIYKSLRYQKETSKKLQELNEEITLSKLNLENANKELEIANATKDKFFSIIAHDLKSPFNSILGLSDILKEYVRDGNLEETKTYAHIIHDSANNTLKLLENLLDWARIQQGKMEFRPKKIDLCKIANEVIMLIGENANNKKIELLNDIPGNTFAYGDPNMVHTIFRNLINNAVKFSWAESTVKITSVISDNKIQISIVDNGVGIDKKAAQKLFNLHSSYTTPGTNNEKGTGLGLILCMEFIQMHNERIWIESDLGKGSIVNFTLPIYNEDFD